MTTPLPSPTSPVNGENIRKAWHNDEWYYSVIDMIAVLLDKETPLANTYWRKLKSRLIAEGNETVTKCYSVKLPAVDGKRRFTDVVNYADAMLLIQEIERRNFKRKKRMQRKQDELENIHPMIRAKFEQEGWTVKRHLELPSGKRIDLLATRGGEMLIIECKRHLVNSELFNAIGQVLCYCAEYGNGARPVVACLEGGADDYTYNACGALGIQVMEVAPV
jgi:Holliday junction resolvase